MRPGVRVVRGPDWTSGDTDGGVGSLGTVVNLYDQTVVQWDNGNVTDCSAGRNNTSDLRLFDNAQIGMVFRSVNCDGCQMKHLKGMRWKCLVCRDYDLCTTCYMGDKHDLTHDFVRYTTTRSCVVKMPCRQNCKKVPLQGILPGASVSAKTVKRPVSTIDEKNESSDMSRTGATAEFGEVMEMVDIPPVAYRGGCLVKWDSGKSATYCVGGDGKVEVFAAKPADGGSLYLNHLPEIDVTAPVETTINPGDKVRCDLNIDTLKFLQKEHGGWVDEMENILGEVGTVTKIDGTTITVKYSGQRPWFLYASVLQKVSNPTVGDTVTVISDKEKLKGFQNYHGGVTGAMLEAAGGTGKVLKVHPTGELLVKTSTGTFLFNPSCCILLPDDDDIETAEEVAAEKEGQTLAVTHIPGLEMDVGVRVLRGPDWKWPDQDGGEGGLGTVIDVGNDDGGSCPAECVMIQWDSGTRNSYRVGYEGAYDLRLYDSSTIGVKHPSVKCSGCESNGIFGTLWTCSSCSDVNLCSECYSKDKHDVDHPFNRIDMQGYDGFRVPKRSMSRKTKLSGIFEEATVVRGPSWRWENQDGGDGRTGVVLGIVNFTPDTDHNGVEVLWETHITNVYRLGYKGDVDLKCTKPAPGGFYYRDHLNILRYEDFCQSSRNPKQPGATGSGDGASDAEKSGAASSSSLRFQSGDRVRIEIDVDILKMIQENHGGWDDRIVECIGKIGTVFHADEKEVVADFGSAGKWMFHEAALTKVKTLKIGDIVDVSDDLMHVRTVQQRRAQWNDRILQLMGKKGRVRMVEEDGDVLVSFGPTTAMFNPDCLTSTKGVEDSIEIESEAAPKVPPPVSAHSDNSKLTANGSLRQTDMNSVSSRETVTDKKVESSDKNRHEQSNGTNDGIPALRDNEGNEVSYSRETPDSHSSTPVDPTVTRPADHDHRSRDEPQPQGHTAHQEVPEPQPQHQPTVLGLTQQLFGAIMINNVKLAWDLIKKQPSLANETLKGKTALHVASHQGREEIVKLCISLPGIQFDEMDDENTTPFLAAVKGNQVKIAVMLLEKGVGIDVVNSNGQTALHLAAQNENVECLQMLIERGCNINAKDRLGDTAVIDAIQTGNQACIDILIRQRDIDLASQNFMGFSAIHFAARKGELRAVKQIVERYPKLVNSAKPDGYTPLHLAACNDHQNITRFFLQQRGIEIDTTNASEQTPLMSACTEGFFEIVKQLVENGANTDRIDEDGNNCLHLVLMSRSSVQEMKQTLTSQDDDLLEEEANRVKVAVFLLEHHVSHEQQNKLGETPIEVAASERVKQTVIQALEARKDQIEAQRQPGGAESITDRIGQGSMQTAPTATKVMCSVSDCDGICHLYLNPCGHGVCFSCGEKAKFCPECGSRIASRRQLDDK